MAKPYAQLRAQMSHDAPGPSPGAGPAAPQAPRPGQAEGEAWRPWISVTDSPYRYVHVEILHPELTRPVIIRTIMIDPITITTALRWRPLPGARPLFS